MSLLGLVGQLGRAIVSWGLGGPGDAPSDALDTIPCPTVRLVAPGHVVARVQAAALSTIKVPAAAHTIARLSDEC